MVESPAFFYKCLHLLLATMIAGHERLREEGGANISGKTTAQARTLTILLLHALLIKQCIELPQNQFQK